MVAFRSLDSPFAVLREHWAAGYDFEMPQAGAFSTQTINCPQGITISAQCQTAAQGVYQAYTNCKDSSAWPLASTFFNRSG